MIGARPALLASLTLVACAPAAPAPRLAEPLLVERDVGVPSCGPGLRLVDRIELAGDFGHAVADASWIYAADDSGLRLFALDGSSQHRVIPTPGEATGLLLTGDQLWIADGTGGLSRQTGLEDPGTEPLQSWHVGGELVALAESGGAVWAADRTGRVLRLPLDAGMDRAPDAVELDGAPGSIATWGQGVLVASGAGGLVIVESGPAGLSVRPAPWDSDRPSRVAAREGVAWVASGQGLRRYEEGVAPTSVELPRRVLGLLPDGEGVLVAAQASGLHRWDGRSDELVTWDASALEGRAGLAAEGLHRLAEDRVLISGGYLGVVEATRTDGSWRAGRVWGSGGEIVSVEAIADELVVGVAVWNDAGRLVAVGPGASGRLEERRSVDAGGWPAAVVPVEGGLAVARRGGGGLGFVGARWDQPGELIALEDSTVTALVSAGPGQLVAGSMDRMLHWLTRTDQGEWGVVGAAELNRLPMPADLAIRDGAVLTVTGAVGMAWRWPGPGSDPEPVRALAAPAGEAAEVFRMGRLLLAGPDLWVGLPSLGLERVSLEGGEGEVVAFSPGAWDVTVWDGELAVARGKAGISLLSPTAPGELLSTCDLPGRIRRVGVLDDRLVAASAGTLFVLER